MSKYYNDRINKTQQEWDKLHTRKINLKLHIVNDADIIQVLDESGNMQGYIKKLIREDITKNE